MHWLNSYIYGFRVGRKTPRYRSEPASSGFALAVCMLIREAKAQTKCFLIIHVCSFAARICNWYDCLSMGLITIVS